MDILIKIDKEVADRLLRLVRADNTQEAVMKVLKQFIGSKYTPIEIPTGHLGEKEKQQ